jgi:acyl-CoA thioester hydrolase
MSENRIYRVRLKVPFHDLDPLNVVWHGNYLKYFDIARFGLFDEAGIDLYRYSLKKKFIFPLTKTSTKYISPLRYNDEFICTAKLLESNVKIVIGFEIRKASDNVVCTRGTSEQVAVKLPEMEIMFEIPDDIRKALEV